MHEAYWGFAESPFRQNSDPGRFFAAGAQREALARLLFAVAQAIPVAILRGPSGVGKTALLGRARAEMPRRGGRTRYLSLCGADRYEALWRLAAELGAAPRSQEPPFLLRQRVADSLRAARLMGEPETILCDDADRAPADVVPFVFYLVRAADPLATIVVARESDRGGELDEVMRDWSPLEIRLDPWTPEEVAGYLSRSMERAGGESGVFAGSAVRRLWELSGGLPRWVRRLAEMSLVAGAVEQRTAIDSAVVEGVFAELHSEAGLVQRSAA